MENPAWRAATASATAIIVFPTPGRSEERDVGLRLHELEGGRSRTLRASRSGWKASRSGSRSSLADRAPVAHGVDRDPEVVGNLGDLPEPVQTESGGGHARPLVGDSPASIRDLSRSLSASQVPSGQPRRKRAPWT